MIGIRATMQDHRAQRIEAELERAAMRRSNR
jgi:hypothetical protein